MYISYRLQRRHKSQPIYDTVPDEPPIEERHYLPVISLSGNRREFPNAQTIYLEESQKSKVEPETLDNPKASDTLTKMKNKYQLKTTPAQDLFGPQDATKPTYAIPKKPILPSIDEV